MLTGRTAVVTGAGHGIGLACATLLAEHGARVVLCDLDREAVASAATALPGDPVCVVGDVTDSGLPEELMRTAWESTGSLDIIANVAGYNLNARADAMSDDTWQRMLDVHATAPFRILRAAAPYLTRAAEQAPRFRKIVNVSSIAVMGSAFQANYAAGKAAVVGLTKSLAKEWAGLQVNVNAVAFGSIDTRLTRPRGEQEPVDISGAAVQLGMSERVMELAVASIPFGRAGTAAEAAGAIFLLCTPWSDWITGQLLVASGGQVFGMSA